MNTLYITDLDGTLLDNDKRVPEHAAKTLNSLIANGVKISYATARSFNSAAPLLRNVRFSCPCAVYNGVFIIDPKSGERLYGRGFSENAAGFARDFFTREKILPIVYSFINGEYKISYIESSSPAVQAYISAHEGDPRMRKARDIDELFEGEIFYFTVIREEKLPIICSTFGENEDFSINVQKDTYDNSIWHEIYDGGCSKAAAARRLKELLGAEELVCFGDNVNDIPMIEAADVGVAVENACGELKSCADFVIEVGGVADFIERHERRKREI